MRRRNGFTLFRCLLCTTGVNSRLLLFFSDKIDDSHFSEDNLNNNNNKKKKENCTSTRLPLTVKIRLGGDLYIRVGTFNIIRGTTGVEFWPIIDRYRAFLQRFCHTMAEFQWKTDYTLLNGLRANGQKAKGRQRRRSRQSFGNGTTQLAARRQRALLLCWCYMEEHDLFALFLAPGWDSFGSLDVQNTLSSLGNDNGYDDDDDEMMEERKIKSCVVWHICLQRSFSLQPH